MYLLEFYLVLCVHVCFDYSRLATEKSKKAFHNQVHAKNPSSDGKNIGENSANMVESNACSTSLQKACFTCLDSSLYQLYSQNQDHYISKDRQVKF